MSFIENLDLNNLEPLGRSSSTLKIPDIKQNGKSCSSIDSKKSFYSVGNKQMINLDFIKAANYNADRLEEQCKFDRGLSSNTIKLERRSKITQRSKVFSYFPGISDNLPRVSTSRTTDGENNFNLMSNGSIEKLSSIKSFNPIKLSTSILPSITSKPLSASKRGNKNMFFPLLVKRDANNSEMNNAFDETLRNESNGVYFIQSFTYLNKI